jgi:hypothetical protein
MPGTSHVRSKLWGTVPRYRLMLGVVPDRWDEQVRRKTTESSRFLTNTEGLMHPLHLLYYTDSGLRSSNVRIGLSNIPLQPNNSSLPMPKSPHPRPRNPQHRPTIRIRTRNQPIRRHPIISIRLALFCCQEWKDTCCFELALSLW